MNPRLVAVGGALVIAVASLVPPPTTAGQRGIQSINANAALPAAAPGAPGRSSRGTAPPLTTTVGLRVITLIDPTRTERLRDGAVKSRALVTQVRYPALGPSGAGDVSGAPPFTAAGPYPLIVFAPGFAESPAPYEQLLDAWVRAGYVVAAPSFPLTKRYVPGGRRESDLIHQPADLSFVISQMLADNTLPASFLDGLIAPALIAIGGQSDGAATALAAAYDPAFADPRVRAAIILSGAELTSIDDHIAFPDRGPPLLAAQGSKDTINEPSATHRYFKHAPRPKFLLTLIGATHLPPYTTQEPYLAIVERVTIAFLDRFIRDEHDSLLRMREAGNVAGIARLTG